MGAGSNGCERDEMSAQGLLGRCKEVPLKRYGGR